MQLGHFKPSFSTKKRTGKEIKLWQAYCQINTNVKWASREF